MSGFDSFGAGRFLPGGMPQFTPQTQAPQMPAPQMPAQGQAFQPNYDLFFNPYTMLQMGQPYFGEPFYQSMGVPQMMPQAAGPAPMQGPSDQMQDWQQRAKIEVGYQDPDVIGNRQYSLQRSCAHGVDNACRILYGG